MFNDVSQWHISTTHQIGTITRRANTRARKFYYVVYQAAYPDPGLMTKEGFPANTNAVFNQLADATAESLVSYTDAHASVSAMRMRHVPPM